MLVSWSIFFLTFNFLKLKICGRHYQHELAAKLPTTSPSNTRDTEMRNGHQWLCCASLELSNAFAQHSLDGFKLTVDCVAWHNLWIPFMSAGFVDLDRGADVGVTVWMDFKVISSLPCCLGSPKALQCKIISSSNGQLSRRQGLKFSPTQSKQDTQNRQHVTTWHAPVLQCICNRDCFEHDRSV